MVQRGGKLFPNETAVTIRREGEFPAGSAARPAAVGEGPERHYSNIVRAVDPSPVTAGAVLAAA
jgi:hypothetical protein